jgi:hypothetical protein
MRLLGSSPRVIVDHFGISVADVNAVIDQKVVKLDNGYRLRAVALDLDRLEEIQARFLRDALSGDLALGHLWLKLAERKAAALGTDAFCSAAASRWRRPQKSNSRFCSR